MAAVVAATSVWVVGMGGCPKTNVEDVGCPKRPVLVEGGEAAAATGWPPNEKW
jgi:hypothetical protein